MADPINVGPPIAGQLAAACRMLFAHRPEPERTNRAERAERLFASGEFDLNELLIATQNGRVVAAGYVHQTTGSAASAWPPHGEPDPAGRSGLLALESAYRDRFHAANLAFAQVLLADSEDDPATTEPLLRIGFQRITRLVGLTRPLAEVDRVLPLRPRLKILPVEETDSGFAELLLETYIGTLDCPELNGTRTGAEILAGYRGEEHSGQPSPGWHRLVFEERSVGVLLLVVERDPTVIELGYVGLIPAARGCGLGGEAISWAIWRAAVAGGEWLNAAVDERNLPADKLYRRHRFRLVDRQLVYLWKPSTRPGSGLPASPETTMATGTTEL